MQQYRPDDVKNSEPDDHRGHQRCFERDRGSSFRTRVFTSCHSVVSQFRFALKCCLALPAGSVALERETIRSLREVRVTQRPRIPRADPCYDVNIGEPPERRLVRSDDALGLK
jgi:hypothetical protein